MGTFTKATRVFNGPGPYVYRTHIVQSKPYRPLAYIFWKGHHINADGSSPVGSGNACAALAVLRDRNTAAYRNLWDQSYAKAFDKFSGKCASSYQTNLGETIGEMASTSALLGERMGQLVRATSSFRKFNIIEGLRHLGLKKPRRSKSYSLRRNGKTVTRVSTTKVAIDEKALKDGVKTVGAVWLEYHLCWSPLMGDIYNSLMRIHDIHPLHFNSKITSTGEVRWNVKSSTTYDYWRGGTTTSYESDDRSYKTIIRANVTVRSPLKRKFRDAGIINPLLIAWNLAPLSMFVDYWLPVSSYLDGFTTFYGLDISNVEVGFRGSAVIVNGQSFTVYSDQNSQSKSMADTYERKYTSGESSLKVPGLFDRRGKGVSSLSRAATLSSVLAQFLR